MKKRMSLFLSVIMLFTLSFTSAFAQPKQPNQSLVHKSGMIAYEHLKVLSGEIGARVAGTDAEAEARDYIAEEFEHLGFETTIQEFVDGDIHSANVIAMKPGRSSDVVIFGAHYDSVEEGEGADDNASGVAIMLEVAEKLKRVSLPYTVCFIAFGAEEEGLIGSTYYADQMSEEDIEHTVAMINLDSLIAGDIMYVYGGTVIDDTVVDGWVREQALNIIDRKKLNIVTQMGGNDEYPAGTTGLWSDHAPFVDLGIPFAYFESTNWNLGDLDGYTQTEKFGEIWHTEMDMITFIEDEFPGRIMERLSSFSDVLSDLLKFMNKTSIAKKAS